MHVGEAVFSPAMPTEIPDSPLWRSSGAGPEDLVATCLVRSGTSRIIVVNRGDAPSGIEDSELALRLFGRDSVADGIGGDHYQLNKLALWNRHATDGIEFAFFNLAPGSRRVSRGAECGHAGVAVALVAGPGRLDGPVRVRNVDTGQLLEVASHEASKGRSGAFLAKVIHDPPITVMNEAELVATSPTGEVLRWETVPAGNIFALVPGLNTCDDEVVRRKIQTVTLEWARDTGHDNASAEFIRTISYDARWEDAGRCRVDVECHNGSEKHNSLPVSGSSALCTHLAVHRLRSAGPPPSADPGRSRIEFDLTSVSGTEIVTVEAERRSDDWEIVSTSCSTNARLLLEGTMFLTR